MFASIDLFESPVESFALITGAWWSSSSRSVVVVVVVMRHCHVGLAHRHTVTLQQQPQRNVRQQQRAAATATVATRCAGWLGRAINSTNTNIVIEFPVESFALITRLSIYVCVHRLVIGASNVLSNRSHSSLICLRPST